MCLRQLAFRSYTKTRVACNYPGRLRDSSRELGGGGLRDDLEQSSHCFELVPGGTRRQHLHNRATQAPKRKYMEVVKRTYSNTLGFRKSG